MWESPLYMSLCSNLDIHLFIKARALEHILDSDLCKLFITYVNKKE